MPNSTSGFTGTEIVNYVKNFVGNQDSQFQSFVEQTLPLAEFRFCKMHDWSFLKKTNLSLTVSSGTNEYALDTSSIGYYMAASDVQSVFSSSNGIYLKRTTVESLRRLDPDANDGNSNSKLTHWAPVSENRIMVYPGNTFSDTTLKVDGKVTPSALLTLSNYPTIPYRYQESFMKYLISLALERENDDRATQLKQDAVAAITADIRDDLASLGGGADEPRMKHQNEARSDGISGNLDALYNQWVWNKY